MRGYEGDWVNWEEVVNLRKGILRRGLGGSVLVCAEKSTE